MHVSEFIELYHSEPVTSLHACKLQLKMINNASSPFYQHQGLPLPPGEGLLSLARHKGSSRLHLFLAMVSTHFPSVFQTSCAHRCLCVLHGLFLLPGIHLLPVCTADSSSFSGLTLTITSSLKHTLIPWEEKTRLPVCARCAPLRLRTLGFISYGRPNKLPHTGWLKTK